MEKNLRKAKDLSCESLMNSVSESEWLELAARANPDLPLSFIKDLFEAEKERQEGLLTEYQFG